MDSQKHRIINPSRYLHMISPDENFYVVSTLSNEDIEHLHYYGIIPNTPARIPEPHGTATKRNASGVMIKHKELSKEPRCITHDYHIIDWHGNDHYGTCDYIRMCYQREFIPPKDLAFIIKDNVLFSPLFKNNEHSLSVIRSAMNIILEMVGHFEIWNNRKAPALPEIKQSEVPWEILRAGTADRSQLTLYINKITQEKTAAQKAAIKGRHEALLAEKPDFYVLGKQNFWGYIVYGFPRYNFYVFECNETENATYFFRDDWEHVSHLTKTEVLSKGLQECRIFHTSNWYKNISEKIDLLRKEVA